jgi:hypothetical protein
MIVRVSLADIAKLSTMSCVVINYPTGNDSRLLNITKPTSGRHYMESR